MGVLKLSQIASAGSPPALSDTIVGVTGGTTDNQFTLSQVKSTVAPTSAALTKVDDTNVTLTLGGSPSTALLNAASITAGWTGQLGVTRGGTGFGTATQGDIIYGSAANTFSKLAKDTNATRYLSNTGSSNNPAWAQINLANGVTGSLPSGSIGLPGADKQILFQDGTAIGQDADFTWDKTSNTLTLNTLTSPGTELVLQQTGDTLGTTRLILRNRADVEGAIFANDNVDSVDFVFEPSSFLTPATYSRLSMRWEHEDGLIVLAANTSTGSGTYSGEWQFLPSYGNPGGVARTFNLGPSAFRIAAPIAGFNSVLDFNDLNANTLTISSDVILAGTTSFAAALLYIDGSNRVKTDPNGVLAYDESATKLLLQVPSVFYNPFAVAALPAAPQLGQVASVNDALAPVAGAAVVGGGAAGALVWWNGAAWNVIAV